MHWMWDAMWARIGWAVGELMLTLSVVFAIGVGIVVRSILLVRKQKKCPHAKTFAAGHGQTEIYCSDCRKFLRHVWEEKKVDMKLQSEPAGRELPGPWR